MYESCPESPAKSCVASESIHLNVCLQGFLWLMLALLNRLRMWPREITRPWFNYINLTFMKFYLFLCFRFLFIIFLILTKNQISIV